MFEILKIFTFDPHILLDISVLFSIIFGLCVISTNNPMFSILYLIGLFIAVAGYLNYIGLGIMSLLYLLIYVGAIAILFLFILSLLDIKLSELRVKSNSNDIPLVILVSVILFYSFYQIYHLEITFLNVNDLLNYKLNSRFNEFFSTGVVNADSLTYVFNDISELPKSLYYILIENWYGLYPINELTAVGSLLYTEYAIVFLLLGVILLLSIIGAIVVTTLKK